MCGPSSMWEAKIPSGLTGKRFANAENSLPSREPMSASASSAALVAEGAGFGDLGGQFLYPRHDPALFRHWWQGISHASNCEG